MGDEVSKPETGEEPQPGRVPDAQRSAHFTQNIQASFQETNLNVTQGLNFPPTEQMHVLEEHCPGSIDRLIAMMQKEASHRQAMEYGSLKEEYEARNSLEAMKHEYYMKELKLEDERISTLTLPIIAPLALLPIFA